MVRSGRCVAIGAGRTGQEDDQRQRRSLVLPWSLDTLGSVGVGVVLVVVDHEARLFRVEFVVESFVVESVFRVGHRHGRTFGLTR